MVKLLAKIKLKVEGFWVSGIDFRVITKSRLNRKFAKQYEDGRAHERRITNRQMSKILYNNHLLRLENYSLRHKFKKRR